MSIKSILGCYILYRLPNQIAACDRAEFIGGTLALAICGTIALIYSYSTSYEDFFAIALFINYPIGVFLGYYIASWLEQEKNRDSLAQYASQYFQFTVNRVGKLFRYGINLYTFIIQIWLNIYIFSHL